MAHHARYQQWAELCTLPDANCTIFGIAQASVVTAYDTENENPGLHQRVLHDSQHRLRVIASFSAVPGKVN